MKTEGIENKLKKNINLFETNDKLIIKVEVLEKKIKLITNK